MTNTLYYGDNLDVLRRYVADESVDLVYLDPPFNSAQNYNVLFGSKDGTQAAAQIQAFEDTWRWDEAAAREFHETVESGGQVSEVLQAFKRILGTNDMLAYLTMMAPRLVELRRVLKSTGSIYLHCDPTASHYLKLLMDAVFGPQQFISEIVWKRTTSHSDAKRWSPVHDTILYYARGAGRTWQPQHLPHSDQYLSDKYTHTEENGRVYRLDNMTSPNPRPNMMYEWRGHASPQKGWRYSRVTMAKLDSEGRIWYPNDKAKRPQLKRYLDEMPGVLLADVWDDISPLNSQAQERLGYPTQKPVALLERVIQASSKPEHVVLDPFCGCGTTIAAAQKLGRRWIGIDITHLAINLIKTRLSDTHGEDIVYKVVGEPTTVEDATELARSDPYQFQWWALGLVGARPAEQKKGADKGVDGMLYFHDGSAHTRRVVFSVKAGGLQAGYIRDLVGVRTREKAEIGVLISLNKPTRKMREEAAAAGMYDSESWGTHPRIQLITVDELLAGARISMPYTSNINRTFKKAPKATKKAAPAVDLFHSGNE